MIKILVAESLHVKTLDELSGQHNFAVKYNNQDSSSVDIVFDYQPDISTEDLAFKIKDYAGLIVRPKEVNSNIIANADNLKLIIRGGAGVNTIDIEAAKDKNIIVENTPGQNSTATAEYTIELLMRTLANRQVDRSVADTKSGDYLEPDQYEGRELEGKSIAIIGYGNIGSRVARICQAFSMDVMVYNRSEKEINCSYFNNIEGVLKKKPDVVSLHIPLSADTDKIINKEKLSYLKKGTILINTARPGLVCPESLSFALDEGIISSFAIDGDYPLVKPFVDLDKKQQGIITHHIADSTNEAQSKITKCVVNQVLAFFRDGKVINGVL